jgi:hypothetical protein
MTTYTSLRSSTNNSRKVSGRGSSRERLRTTLSQSNTFISARERASCDPSPRVPSKHVTPSSDALSTVPIPWAWQTATIPILPTAVFDSESFVVTPPMSVVLLYDSTGGAILVFHKTRVHHCGKNCVTVGNNAFVFLGPPNSLYMDLPAPSIASTPSLYTSIVDLLPDVSEKTPESIPTSESPGVYGPQNEPHALFRTLTRQRLRMTSIEDSLHREQLKFETMYREGEELKIDLARYVEIVTALKKRNQQANQIWRVELKTFNNHQKNFSTLKSAVSGIRSAWREEAVQFNKLSDRLRTLRSKRPQLDQELTSVSSECEKLSEQVAAAILERERLSSLLSKLVRSNKEADDLIQQRSMGTQTSCDFRVLDDLSNIHKQLDAQIKTVKGVRQAIDLVRRCT